MAQNLPSALRAVCQGIEDVGWPHSITAVSDGIEAEECLASGSVDFVIIDLELSGKDGRSVLSAIKEDRRTRHIPVIVLAASSAEEDIAASYAGHANCYVSRPRDPARVRQLVRTLSSFWLRAAQLP